MKTKFLSSLCFVLFCSPFIPCAFAQGTTFTYQGRVQVNGANFTGIGQFKFALVTSTNTDRTAAATANISGGFVTTYNVTSGGNGYVSPPVVTVFGGGGSGATATASVSGGIVTGVTAVNPGSGYTNAPTVLIAPPPPVILYTTYWSNDGTSVNGSEPTAGVNVAASNGLFTVVLGDTTVANMTAINPALFTQPNLQLRTWFSDGVHGFAALDPAQNLTPTPYAIIAGTVSGAVADAHLSSNVPLLNGNQTFTGQNTFNSLVGINGPLSVNNITIAGDAEIGTSAGDYRHLRIGGGNSSGFLWGSYPWVHDTVHLSYNFYADAAGNGHVINPGGGTSRVTVGYGYIALLTGGVNSTPSQGLSIDGGGNVTMGFNLTVFGTAYKPGGGSWTSTSDARLKKNIRPLAGVLDRLLALRGVSFEFKEPEKIHELPGERIGMIAQEVEKVFPDWVETGADGFKRLTYRGFEALTVEALRQMRTEQDAKVAALESRIEQLKNKDARIEALENTIGELRELVGKLTISRN